MTAKTTDVRGTASETNMAAGTADMTKAPKKAAARRKAAAAIAAAAALAAAGAPASAATVTDVSDVVEAASKCVVSVTAKTFPKWIDDGRGADGSDDPFGWVGEIGGWNAFGAGSSGRDPWFGSTQSFSEGAGSGFIVSKTDDALLVATNAHVVDGADEVAVTFSAEADDAEALTAKATVKGTDEASDLAILSVDADDVDDAVEAQVEAARLGSSADLKVGQGAIVIGNALGEGQTVTTGVVSALGVDFTVDGRKTRGAIQTDAAVNLGCSGGPVFDADGEVIGVTDAKAVAGYAESMGYAIPIDDLKAKIDKMSNGEKAASDEERGWLGATVTPTSREARELYGIPAGAYVTETEEGSAAEAAGLMEGDVITSLDGEAIDGADALVEALSWKKPGDEATIGFSRREDGTYVEHEGKAALGSAPEKIAGGAEAEGDRKADGRGGAPWTQGSPEAPEAPEEPEARGVPSAPDDGQKDRKPDASDDGSKPQDADGQDQDADGRAWLGASVATVSREARELYGVPAGALVVETEDGSAAEAAGLTAGDVVTSVDGEAIDGAEALADAIAGKRPGDETTIGYSRREADGYAERETKAVLGEARGGAEARNEGRPGTDGENADAAPEKTAPDQASDGEGRSSAI